MIRPVLLALLAVGCLSKPERPDYDGTGATGRIAAGGKHACEIDDAGHLWCWGTNASGELGPATALPMTGSPASDMSTGWTWVAAGEAHTCAIQGSSPTTATIYCWGADGLGGLQPGDTSPGVVEVPLPNGASPAKVFAGGAATCAIDLDGNAYCWGTYDPAASPPGGSDPASIAPGEISGPWARIAIADDHVCALTADTGELYCWGDNTHSQLGVAGTDMVALAHATRVDGEFVAVSAGLGTTCAATRDHALECWGSSASGELGSTTGDSLPVVVDNTAGLAWSAVATGIDHACAARAGSMACWGTDDRGALGDGFAGHAIAPETSVLDRVIDFAAGRYFTCALDSANEVWCWGANAYGELGNDEIATKWQPVQVTTDNVTSVVATDGRTCALDGATAICWGDNRLGQATGDPSTPFITTPQRGPTTGFSDLQLGTSHTCGLAPGAISCWGDNSSGQLGPNAVDNVGTIPPPSAGGTWLSLSAGGNATCGIEKNGTVLSCWGDVPNDPRLPASSTVTHVGAALAISIGENLGIAVTGNAGEQLIGAFGTDCGVDYSFGQPHHYESFSATSVWTLPIASDHACVYTVDSPSPTSFECAGSNDVGQINDSGGCLGATPVGDPTTYGATWADPTTGTRRAAVGTGHTCAIALTNNMMYDAYALFCWGSNTAGELEDKPSPVAFGAFMDLGPPGPLPPPGSAIGWSGVATGARHTCAIAYTQTAHADGPLYCWGENRYGEVGDGTRFHELPQPVAIPKS